MEHHSVLRTVELLDRARTAGQRCDGGRLFGKQGHASGFRHHDRAAADRPKLLQPGSRSEQAGAESVLRDYHRSAGHRSEQTDGAIDPAALSVPAVHECGCVARAADGGLHLQRCAGQVHQAVFTGVQRVGALHRVEDDRRQLSRIERTIVARRVDPDPALRQCSPGASCVGSRHHAPRRDGLPL